MQRQICTTRIYYYYYSYSYYYYYYYQQVPCTRLKTPWAEEAFKSIAHLSCNSASASRLESGKS